MSWSTARTLGLLAPALGCGPALPRELEVTRQDLPVVEGAAPLRGFRLYEVPGGLLVSGGDAAVLVHADGRMEALPLDVVTSVSADGWATLTRCAHAAPVEVGYHLPTRTWGPAPKRAEASAEPGPVTLEPGGVVALRSEDGATRRVTLSLPEGVTVPGEVWEGPAGRAWLSYGNGPSHTLLEWPEPATFVVLALDLLRGRPVAGERYTFTWPARSGAPEDPRAIGREGVEALVQTKERAWLLQDGRLGWLARGRWTPEEGLGGVHDLLQTEAGALWAVGDGLWRREGGRWRVVWAPAAEAVLSARAPSPLAEVRGLPLLNAPLFDEAGRRCGAEGYRSPFVDLSGACAGWGGRTRDGAVLRGVGTTWERLEPPVGQIHDLDRAGDTLVVSGAEGLAWTGAGGWTRVATALEPWWVEAVQTEAGLEVWFYGREQNTDAGATRHEVCWTRGEAPRCQPVDGPLSTLAAFDGVAWALGYVDTALFRIDAQGGVEELGVDVLASVGLVAGSEHRLGALAADPGRGLLWLGMMDSDWAVTEMLALDADSGRVRARYPLSLEPGLDRLGLTPEGELVWSGRLARAVLRPR